MTSENNLLVADLTGRDLFFTRDFTAEELQSRRVRIAEEIGSGAHLLVASAPPVPGDVPVQDAVFYYCSGLETCHSYLVVEGGTGRASVFMPSSSTIPGAEDDKLGFEDADLIKERLNIAEVLPSSELTAALQGVKKLFIPHSEVEGGGVTKFDANGCAKRRFEEEWDQAEPRHKKFIRLLQERLPGVRIEDACPIVDRMRMVKSPAEIEVLREAAELSAQVMIEAMKATKPGMCENRLQAIAEYVFRDQGHCGPGYAVIAAGGKRTWDGHYHRNNMTLHEDEIILMDCGPDLRHYTSDIARLWPVNGTFSKWHRRIYGFILEYHKTLLGLVKPGVRTAEIYDEADRKMSQLCTGDEAPYADMKPIFEQMVAKGIGYMNHAVGLSVHDAVDGSWKSEPLQEGLVFVADPMVWCDDRHEYIRVEDTIVVTADGCERLTGTAPAEIDEIEALMKTA